MTTDHDELEYVKVYIETTWTCLKCDFDNEDDKNEVAIEQDGIVICGDCGEKFRCFL